MQPVNPRDQGYQPEVLYRVIHDRGVHESGTTYYDEELGIIPGAAVITFFGKRPSKKVHQVVTEEQWQSQAILHTNWSNRRPTYLSSWCSSRAQTLRIVYSQLNRHQRVRVIAVRRSDLKANGIESRCNTSVLPATSLEHRSWEWLVFGHIPAKILSPPHEAECEFASV